MYPVEGAGHGLRWWESYPTMAEAYKRKLVQWLREQLGGGDRLASQSQRRFFEFETSYPQDPLTSVTFLSRTFEAVRQDHRRFRR